MTRRRRSIITLLLILFINSMSEATATSAQNTIKKAESIVPTAKAVEQTRLAEMNKVIDLIEERIPEVGSFAKVYGEKGTDGRFAVFNEPVEFRTFFPKGNTSLGKYDIGLVFVTPDGFKARVEEQVDRANYSSTVTHLKNRVTMVAGTPKYEFYQGKPVMTEGGRHYELSDLSDESVVTKAIKNSIAEAQKEPKERLKADQTQIRMAGTAQVALNRAALGK